MNAQKKKKRRRRVAQSKLIRKCMIDRDLSVLEFAKAGDCSSPMICMIISGCRSSKGHRLEKMMARRLRRPLRELFPRQCSAKIPARGSS